MKRCRKESDIFPSLVRFFFLQGSHETGKLAEVRRTNSKYKIKGRPETFGKRDTRAARSPGAHLLGKVLGPRVRCANTISAHVHPSHT